MLRANRSDTDENSNVIPEVNDENGTETNNIENVETVTAKQQEKGLEDTNQAEENKTEGNKNKHDAKKATARCNEVIY